MKKPEAFVFRSGIGLFALGLLCAHLPFLAESQLPMFLTGFGAGITGVGVIKNLQKQAQDKDPDKARAYAIAQRDERNIHLKEKAGYGAWFVSIFILCALAVVFLLMDLEIAALCALGALLLHVGMFVVFVRIMDKRN